MRTHTIGFIGLAVAVAGASCTNRDGGKPGAGSATGSGSAAVPGVALPALGVDEVQRFNYSYGKAEAAYDRAVAAHKAKDWAAMKAAAAEAVAADADHLDAAVLHAIALVQLGTPDGAGEQLIAILARDPLRLRAELRADLDLAAFWATPPGAAFEAAASQLDAAVARVLTSGVVVLARRVGFKWPSKPGAQWAATRGEVYAFDPETARYLRLTHTGHSVAAMVVAPGRGEVAVVGYDKVEMPDPASPGDPPVLARSWAQAYDATTWVPTSEKVTIGRGRAVAVAYGAGDQLLVAAIAPDGRWGLGAATWSSVDRSTGKLARTSAAPGDAPRAVVMLDEAWVEGPLVGATVTWSEPGDGGPALATKIDLANGRSIEIPESGKAPRDSISMAPGGTRLAFATWTDPCGDHATRSIYVADAITGQPKHLLTDASRFRSRWLDDDRLIYEDASARLRIWSFRERRELARIASRGGLALATLDPHTAPPCKGTVSTLSTTPQAEPEHEPE